MLRYILCSAAALTAIAGLYFLDIRLSSVDLPFYRKLVQESIDLHAHSALEKAPVRQMRKGVRKDIWKLKNGVRAHSRVESATSDVLLTQKKGKIEAIEVSQAIEAWIDENAECRHFIAESGACYFPSCRMEAKRVVADVKQVKCTAKESLITKDSVQLLGTFLIEHPMGRLFGEQGTLALKKSSNHLLIEEGVLFESVTTPFAVSSMRAETMIPKNASRSDFSTETIRLFDGVEIQTAYGVRAAGNFAIIDQNSFQLFPEPDSLCSLFHNLDRIDAHMFRFDRTINELLCNAPHGYFEEQQTVFDAAIGRALFDEKSFQPRTFFLEGNVRIASHLQNKGSLAIADSAIFQFNQKKVILTSSPLSRVLFRQEGLEISAPTVHIQKAIQGFGDVRCFFSPEEESALDTIFMKYL